MHCYHMALNLFQNLDNLWKFAKGCESFIKMAQKGLLCMTVWYNQNSFYQEKPQTTTGHLQMMTTTTLLQNSTVPKVDLLQHQISWRNESVKKIKQKTMGKPLPKCWECMVHVHTMSSTCWQYTPSVTSVGLKWQYIQNDSLPGLCCTVYIRPCSMTSSKIHGFLWASKACKPTGHFSLGK